MEVMKILNSYIRDRVRTREKAQTEDQAPTRNQVTPRDRNQTRDHSSNLQGRLGILSRVLPSRPFNPYRVVNGDQCTLFKTVQKTYFSENY